MDMPNVKPHSPGKHGEGVVKPTTSQPPPVNPPVSYPPYDQRVVRLEAEMDSLRRMLVDALSRKEPEQRADIEFQKVLDRIQPGNGIRISREGGMITILREQRYELCTEDRLDRFEARLNGFLKNFRQTMNETEDDDESWR